MQLEKTIPNKKVPNKNMKENAPTPPPPPRVETLSVMVAVNGESYGPYDKDTLLQMIQNGTLTRDTYVFIDGMSEWRLAKEVPQVASLFMPEAPKSGIPPLPPKTAAASAPASKRITVKKCPHCGAPAKLLATECPECGYEYPLEMCDNNCTASERLAKAIAETREKEASDKKSKRWGIGIFSFYRALFGFYASIFNGKLIKSLVTGSFLRTKDSELQALTILHFPVPNNKIDILDLFSTCASNCDYSFTTLPNRKHVAKAYKKKASEILMKARIVAHSDHEFLGNIEAVAQQRKIR